MATAQLPSTAKTILTRTRARVTAAKAQTRSRQVPIQIMAPEDVRQQVLMMHAERGESIRTIVLRGLRAIGISIDDSELIDRRGRHRQRGGHSNGQS